MRSQTRTFAANLAAYIGLASLVFGVVSVAHAGPGFIESSRVSGEAPASIEVRFNCKAEYVRHEPEVAGDRLRIYLDPTGICNGVSPVVAASRSRLRPVNSDNAQLVDVEYDGDSPAGPTLTFNFSQSVSFDVDMSGVAFDVTVAVTPDLEGTAKPAEPASRQTVAHRQVARPTPADPDYVINLASFTRTPTVADAEGLELASDQRLFYSEVLLSLIHI